MNYEAACRLLGERIRVWDGQHHDIRAQGKLIAVVNGPVLVVEDDDGVRYYEASTLPIEAAIWTPQ